MHLSGRRRSRGERAAGIAKPRSSAGRRDSDETHSCELMRRIEGQAEGNQTVCKLSCLPVESSCSPTSKDSLSVCDLDVFKQARYWVGETERAVTHNQKQRRCFPPRPPGCSPDGNAVRSYHGAEGVPQEDGVSVQEGLVSTALRCLQIAHKALRYNTRSSRRPSCPPHPEY